jgi:NADH:ubiquinone oxidoreductase subunit D
MMMFATDTAPSAKPELSAPKLSQAPGVTSVLHRDAQEGELIVNIGPQHPSTHGVLRLVTTLKGEQVRDMECIIGYLHRSKEKMAETRTYFQYQPTIDRVEYLSSFFDHYAFVSTIESISNLKIPKRTEYIRMICMELNRISSHLLWYGTFLLDLGATSPFFWAFRDREMIFKLFEELTGARMMYNYFRFGGAVKDIPEGWLDQVQQFVDYFPARIDEFEAVANKNPIILDRTVGLGIMDKDHCLAYGVTGPSLRATGVAQDLRKTNPYGVYSELEFDVPVFTHGDVYDRYQVRMLEMRESLRLIAQGIQRVKKEYGGEPSNVDKHRKAVEEAKAKLKAEGGDPKTVEDINFDWNTWGQKVNLMLFKPAKGEGMTMVESPRGMLGCYIVSDASPKAYRIKWRGASFSNLSVLPSLMYHQPYPDLMPIFGSLDVILPEVDR